MILHSRVNVSDCFFMHMHFFILLTYLFPSSLNIFFSLTAFCSFSLKSKLPPLFRNFCIALLLDQSIKKDMGIFSLMSFLLYSFLLIYITDHHLLQPRSLSLYLSPQHPILSVFLQNSLHALLRSLLHQVPAYLPSLFLKALKTLHL